MVDFIYFYLSREKKQELETYADKLNRILIELKKERSNQGWFLGGFICTDTSFLACVACLQKMDCYTDEGFWFNAGKKDYRKVKNDVKTSESIVAVIKILLTDPTNNLTPQLTDGSTSTQEKVCF